MAAKWFNRLLAKIGLQRTDSAASASVRNDATLTGTELNKLWDWIMAPLGGWQTIDVELQQKLWSLRREARRLALNNPIIRQYLGLLENNVIGPNGMRLQAQIRNNDGKLNKTINDKIESGWSEFWSSPWADGRMSGIAGERLLIKSIAVDGEVFVRRLISPRFKYGIALQMIDPDLIDYTLNQPKDGGKVPTSNEIRLGIEVDEYGKAVAYWCFESSPYDINTGNSRQRIRIPGEEITHLYDPERVGQTRGFTWFNTVMQNLKNQDGYVEAAIVAARTAACAVPIFKQTSDMQVLVDDNGMPKDQSGYSIDLSPGSGFTLPVGLELQNWDPKHPNTNHAEFLKGNNRYTSCGLRVSYNALCNDLEGVNYSSMRSGLLIERDGWRSLHRMWIDRFRQQVFEWFLWGGLLSGALVLDSRDPRKFRSVKWIPRGWDWVDPLKDVNAAVIAIENGLGSRTAYLGEQGEDFEEVCEELANEKQIAQDSGLDFSGAAVTAKDVVKQTEEETVGAQKKASGAKARLRLIVLNTLLESEEIDSERVNQLMNLYRKGA